MDFAIDQSFYTRAKAMLDKIDQNQKLQQLASANGIDVKNSTQLNEATKNNIATSVIALMLAKQSNDPRYADLVRYGMDHRKTKIEIINDYKDQANQIISRAKKNDFNNLSGFAETYLSDPDDKYEFFEEGYGSDIAKTIILLPFTLIKFVLSIIGYLIELIHRLIRSITSTSPNKIIKKLEKLSNEEKDAFGIKANGDIVKVLPMLAVQSSIVESYKFLIDMTLSIDPNSDSYPTDIRTMNGAWALLNVIANTYRIPIKFMKRMDQDSINQTIRDIESNLSELRGMATITVSEYDELEVPDEEMFTEADQQNATFDSAENDIRNKIESNSEYLNYEQTINILKAMNKYLDIKNFEKIHKDFKASLNRLKKAERESRSQGTHDNYSPIRTNFKIGNIKEASSSIMWSITYMCYDISGFLNSIIKDGIKKSKKDNDLEIEDKSVDFTYDRMNEICRDLLYNYQNTKNVSVLTFDKLKSDYPSLSDIRKDADYVILRNTNIGGMKHCIFIKNTGQTDPSVTRLLGSTHMVVINKN